MDEASPKLDTTVPHPARVYDYWLGGCSPAPARARPRTSGLTCDVSAWCGVARKP
ncbi:MAG TPA: SAM-dependent methyltransferase [Streptosporangiaceae bacterium]